MEGQMIRVLLVDDQALARAGLKMILGPEDGFEVVGECGDGAAALAAVANLRRSGGEPDVVLMDVRMRGMDGVEATRRLRAEPDGPPVLILTTFDDDEILSAALRAGAAGFLLKDAPAEDLIRATRTVAEGGAWLDPAVTRSVVDAFVRRGPSSPAPRRDPRLDQLTPRELEVLGLLARGRSNQDIATALFVSEGTTKTHVSNVLMKLQLRDRVQAVVFAYENGVVVAGDQDS